MDMPLIVQAEYSFKGGNNDELCFKKGDLITVTQREEGGWWEGTFNEKTGWFPSNYVNEYKSSLPIVDTVRLPEDILEYRSVVLKDLTESEKAHVAEIRGLLENFLEPLQETQILNADEYAQLMSNFVEVVHTHEELLTQIEDSGDRVGKLFLTKATKLKQIHQMYCAAHPKAIIILDKHKDELETYMESRGAASPGLLVLTTGLSKPFRRMDKYSAMLQELERHMESSHPDRGDTQRSVAVYKDIAATCSATRRQKELELQVLTGPVRGWQGQELSTLGDIIHMGSVAIGSDHRDRYLVLFPQTLLILSVSQRMSAFIYEGKLNLTNISVNRMEDTDTHKNAFEICSSTKDRLLAICQGPNEANKWVELLTVVNKTMPFVLTRQNSNLSNTSYNCAVTNVSSQNSSHISQPPIYSMLTQRSNTTIAPSSLTSGMSQHKRSLSFNHHLSYNQYIMSTQSQPHPQNQLPQQQPQSLPNHQELQNSKSNLVQISNNISKITNQTLNTAISQGNTANGKITSTKANWSVSNLRPAPPLRPNLFNTNTISASGGSSNTLSIYFCSRKVQPTYEEDALVLRVFEAYCSAYQSNVRNTNLHSALQPWTPCLPIRSGKLNSTKLFSTSNPHLNIMCSSASNYKHPSNENVNNSDQPRTSRVLNSSYIWREASPNNFNLYSSSVSSLNTGLIGIGSYRYSSFSNKKTHCSNGSADINYRAFSEERATRKSLNRFKSGVGSGYDNIFMTPLLPQKKNNTSTYKTDSPQQSSIPKSELHSVDNVGQLNKSNILRSSNTFGLYDRRLNRSFETSSSYRYAGYGGGYIMENNALKSIHLRRSSPQLNEDKSQQRNILHCENLSTSDIGVGGRSEKRSDVNSGNLNRQSESWCCGNFVIKQWRKINNY